VCERVCVCSMTSVRPGLFSCRVTALPQEDLPHKAQVSECLVPGIPVFICWAAIDVLTAAINFALLVLRVHVCVFVCMCVYVSL